MSKRAAHTGSAHRRPDRDTLIAGAGIAGCFAMYVLVNLIAFL